MTNANAWRHQDVLSIAEGELQSRIQKETDAILSGRCTDHLEYKVRLERRKAFVEAIEVLGESLRTYLQEDENDDE